VVGVGHPPRSSTEGDRRVEGYPAHLYPRSAAAGAARRGHHRGCRACQRRPSGPARVGGRHGAAGAAGDAGRGRHQAGRPQGAPQPGSGRGAPRQRAWPGHPWWPPGAGTPTAGPDRRRDPGGATAELPGVCLHRVARRAGVGADAGQAVDAPVSGRAGTRRRAGHRVRQGDLEVGGLPPVCCRYRARPGRVAARRPVGPGSGRAAGGRRPRRRAHLCDRAGHHPGRHQGPAGAGRRRDRERHRGA
jgi:hypothetical protein